MEPFFLFIGSKEHLIHLVRFTNSDDLKISIASELIAQLKIDFRFSLHTV